MFTTKDLDQFGDKLEKRFEKKFATKKDLTDVNKDLKKEIARLDKSIKHVNDEVVKAVITLSALITSTAEKARRDIDDVLESHARRLDRLEDTVYS